MQDRPTAVELLEAIREFLEQDVMPAVEGRVQFHSPRRGQCPRDARA